MVRPDVLPFSNRLTATARVQRLHIILPVDSSGAVWDFEITLDPRNRIAEADERNNTARFAGACGGKWYLEFGRGIDP